MFSAHRFARAFRRWMPIAVAVTAMCGLVYVAVQQDYRSSLNDPQVQLAEDGAQTIARAYDEAHLLVRGGSDPVQSVVGSGTVDMDRSLASFVNLYRRNGSVLTGSGRLRDRIPSPPIGVLTAAAANGRSIVTWQPMPGVRIAAVVVPASPNVFVLAGRNMREVEARIDALTKLVGLAWLVTLAATFVATWLFTRNHRRPVPQEHAE